MKLIDIEALPRRTMVLFFVVDTSNSMSGNKIAATNVAVRRTMPLINNISKSNPDAEIQVAILKFNNRAEWVTTEPMHANDLEWNDVDVCGGTSLGAACVELNSKLSRQAYMKSDGGYYAPVFILLSDGEPTDDYQNGLAELKKNKWFKSGIKTAIAIGEDADKRILAEFTGDPKAVFEINGTAALIKMIRLIAVSSSVIGSQSATGDDSKQEKVIDEIYKEVKSVESFSNPSSDLGLDTWADEDIPQEDYNKYGKEFSEDGFFEKIKNVFKKAGIKVVYVAILLYYVMKSDTVPFSTKASIVGALGYFILPADLIPDFIPVVGYADDWTALYGAYKLAQGSITPEIERQSQAKLTEWFGNFDKNDIII